MPRTVEQIIEDVVSLWYAWPTAPRELFDELRDELEQAVMRENGTEVRHGTEAIRRTPRPRRSKRTIG